MKEFSARKLGKVVELSFPDNTRKEFTAKSTDQNDFVNDYIDYFEKHYPYQLKAIELFLVEHRGEKYVANLKKVPHLYKRRVVFISLSCSLCSESIVPSFDKQEELNFVFAKCPLRGECQYNGFDPKLHNNKYVICNPIYKLSLEEEEIKIAYLLIKTKADYNEIANAINIPVETLEYKIQEIYRNLNVKDRFELLFMLAKKRIK